MKRKCISCKISYKPAKDFNGYDINITFCEKCLGEKKI